MVRFITEQHGIHSVERICKVLPIAPSTYYEHARRVREHARVPARVKRDQELLRFIRVVWNASSQRYGVRKVWHELLRGDADGRWPAMSVARCTVERLMRGAGLRGVSRGARKVFTTMRDEQLEKPRDLVERDFVAAAPNRLWVADLTFVKTIAGFVYVAFIVDAFAMRIVGWQVSNKMNTQLVLDALQQAMSEREIGTELIHHSDHGSQYLSIRYSQELRDASIATSVGSTGDAYDNALAETINGLFKTEVIHHFGAWENVHDVMNATMQWVHWFNEKRLYEKLGYTTPAEYEKAYYQQSQAAA